MLTMVENEILNIMSKRQLITKSELAIQLQKDNHNGVENAVQRLKDMGYIDTVESLGNCLVITQSGIRTLKE
jgi:hypothetical protein